VNAPGRRGGGPAPAIALLAALLPAVPVSAQSPADAERRLQRIEREMGDIRARDERLAREAEARARELEDLRARLVATADEQDAAERALAAAEEELRGLDARDRAATEALEARRGELDALVRALIRISRLPPDALAIEPGGAEEAVRARIVMERLLPRVRAQADALSADLADLAATRAAADARRADARRLRGELAARETRLADLAARREALLARSEAERARLADRQEQLAARATDLRGLLDRIEEERRAAEARAAEARAERERAAQQRAERERAERERAERERRDAAARPPASRGGLPALRLPVAGRVVQGFGEADRHGATSRGLVLDAPAEARVVAPGAGRVMFAGPFRGYGLILIVEHAGGYHSLVSGLGRLDVAIGQDVLAGEPVGAAERGSGGRSRLYLELRRGGQPVDPARALPDPDRRGQG
jgi:septal ring factor EnvC (AmiA/AmiB activator)